jgi:hypothetical protein
MGALNVRAYLYRRGARLSYLELVHVTLWSIVLARVGVVLLFGFVTLDLC